MNSFSLLVLIAEALVMLFELRSLMQSSNVDYYNRLVQSVVKLTEPVFKLVPVKRVHLLEFYYGGFIIAAIISLIFWFLMRMFFFRELAIGYVLLIALIMVIKTFGYLIICLLMVQALTSWLPSTRYVSYLIGQITSPITAPVQKIIPPIGMIDISLMVVLIAVYALNSLCFKLFGTLWILV